MKRSGIELSSPSQPSKRLHRDGSGSSSLQSLTLPSSQPLAESSQPISTVTEKSLGDYNASDKVCWRDFEEDPDKFFKELGLSTASKEHLRDSFRVYAKHRKKNFGKFLVYTALTELREIKEITKRSRSEELIQWSRIDLSGSSEMTEASCDDLVFCWLESAKVNHPATPEHKDAYEQLFCRLLPIVVKTVEETSAIVASAFHREEKPTPDGRLASEAIYRKIVHYYHTYTNGKYLAPYTSVVGPSGIGKSFLVSQMAHSYGLYVVYSNLAAKDKAPYPERSVFADILPDSNEAKTVQVAFWECYILVAMCDVELCRIIGISPSGFYYLQTMKRYRSYQEDFSRRLSSFFERFKNTQIQKDGTKQEHRAKLVEILRSNVGMSQKGLELCRLHLETDNHNPAIAETTDRDVPNALICLDEARALLEGEGSPLFRSFREAIRKRFARTGKTGALNLAKSRGDYFALLLDTTSKVSSFSPPMISDHSQKIRQSAGGLLFQPLFAIDTIDIFEGNDQERNPDGSEESATKLFHFGRPLWGALAALKESPRDILELAKQKVVKQGPSYLTAILSYRLSFYITNNTIAEDLVSGWLRYILYINERRDLLLTCQPSEPVLVHVSAEQMSDPATRVQVLQQFSRISFEGSINTGDMGEIVAAIVLFFTYDEVLYNEAHEFPGAVPFEGFLTGLLGIHVARQTMECSSTDTEMGQVCSNSKVFCNHFFKIEEDPTSKMLENAFLRGAGIILPDQFPGADLLVPMRLPDKQMTFFGIQVKNRTGDSYSSSLKEETSRSFSKLSKRLGIAIPFVGLTMALKGENTNQTQMVGIVQPHKPTGYSTRRAAPASTEYEWPKKNKRLLLLAVGLDETVYPSIGRCMGHRTPESESLFPLLKALLNCKPGVTLPDDADLRFADRVRSLDV